MVTIAGQGRHGASAKTEMGLIAVETPLGIITPVIIILVHIIIMEQVRVVLEQAHLEPAINKHNFSLL